MIFLMRSLPSVQPLFPGTVNTPFSISVLARITFDLSVNRGCNSATGKEPLRRIRSSSTGRSLDGSFTWSPAVNSQHEFLAFGGDAIRQTPQHLYPCFERDFAGCEQSFQLRSWRQ